MENVLYIAASPRGKGVSRTLQLADAFWAELSKEGRHLHIQQHDVAEMGLQPVDGKLLAHREALIDARAWDDPLFAPAREFAKADALVIAAPYWDLMFPSMLKVYIEHIFIRELTFCYRNDKPIGLCKAKWAVFFTTAGSPIENLNFGTEYMRAILAMLGVPRFDYVAAEGLDLSTANVQEIMEEGELRAGGLAHALSREDRRN